MQFIEKVYQIFSGVTKGNNRCYITGDFNLDLLKHEYHSVIAQFIKSLLLLISSQFTVSPISASALEELKLK